MLHSQKFVPLLPQGTNLVFSNFVLNTGSARGGGKNLYPPPLPSPS